MKYARDLGEFDLIRTLTKKFSYSASVVKGVGDDCAVIEMPSSKKSNIVMVATSDMLLEGRHFTIKKDTLASIGHKALACSISDIAAIGGIPQYALVSLGIRPKFPAAFIEKIYEGMRRTARKFRVDIVGGDTIASQKLIIDVMMCGTARKKDLVFRGGAQDGDVLCVTGALGGAVVSGHHLMFTPRLKESRVLTRNFTMHSMIDLSDGLGSDLLKLCAASGKSARIYRHLLPVRKNARTIDDILYQGEDYELLFSAPAPEVFAMVARQKALGIKVYPIGEIIPREKETAYLVSSENIIPLRDRGFKHF
jgi:thiamine-monophosphate kinase